ncbi:MAG: hypothetical protein QOI13_769 [Paraburkholderia sp.]|jgi:hypothetical protein|nr:hypothetical protein [Paraburkholderia sp.]
MMKIGCVSDVPALMSLNVGAAPFIPSIRQPFPKNGPGWGNPYSPNAAHIYAPIMPFGAGEPVVASAVALTFVSGKSGKLV